VLVLITLAAVVVFENLFYERQRPSPQS
jgi:hypothetical protein